MRDIINEIQNKLEEIEQKEQVRILYAVESGSRAWGFASPDSDYDVRFVYVRSKESYLRLDQPRDVIEWQLDEVLDINGWDLKKTLIQFHRSNAGLIEWSNSPIVYKITEEWKELYEAARGYFSVKAAAYHYYGTANSTYFQHLQGETVKYKKYFYAIRPLLAGKYIQMHQSPPPVLFDELMQMDMPVRLRGEIEKLLIMKKKSGEKKENPPIPFIQNFIEDELQSQKRYVEGMGSEDKHDWAALNQIFLKVL